MCGACVRRRLNFEIPNYQVSGLRIRGLAVDVDDKKYDA